MVTKSDYPDHEVQTCFSVLLDLMTVLGEFRDKIVIMGGHVPRLALPKSSERYQGTLDIDLAMDFRRIDDTTYKTLVETLKENGYFQKEGEQPFKFFREVKGKTFEIDLLAGEYGGTGEGRRHQEVQDARARKARGCELVFDHYIEVKLDGKLPSGADNSVQVRVAGIGPFLVTKGMALWTRKKEKDAYDVYFCIKNYPAGYKALAEELRPIVENSLVQEGLGKIRAKFEKVNSIGPNFVADFLEITDSDARENMKREAYENVKAFLDELEIPPFDELPKEQRA